MKSRVARKGTLLLTALVLAATPLIAPSTAGAEVWAFGAAWNGEGHYMGVSYVSSGNAVGVWEQVLINRYDFQCTHNGTFTSCEDTWTEEYQDDHGVTVDGVVGAQTWSAARWWHLSLDTDWGDWEDWIMQDVGYSTYERYAPWDGWMAGPYDCDWYLDEFETVDHPTHNIDWTLQCD